MSLVHEIDNGFLLVPNVKNYDHKKAVFIKELPPEVAEALRKHAEIEAEEAKRIADLAKQAKEAVSEGSLTRAWRDLQNQKIVGTQGAPITTYLSADTSTIPTPTEQLSQAA